jgi:cytochrome c oxidase cbb3-type subunit 3
MRRLVNYKYSIVLVLLTLVSGVSAWAQDAAATEAAPAPEASSDGWMFWGLTTVVLFIVFLMISVFAKLKGLEEDEYTTTEKVSFKQKWAELNQRIFTKAVPVEKEEDILLDHDYDGIKELDNALPPWWKWGFYITVVVAVIYFVRFHVLENGHTP